MTGRLALLGVLTAATLAVLLLTTTVPNPALLPQRDTTTTGPCLPTSENPAEGGGDAQLTAQQRSIAGRIIELGRREHLPPRAWQVAIQAGKTESNLANLDYGDRDSLGIFQMRPSMGWGTPEQLTNVDYQITKFYAVLRSVPNWEGMRPGEAAQKVERSAYPERYHEWETLAARLISTLGNVPNPSGCGPTTGHGNARAVLDFAHAQLGKPYGWGATGPDAWDCSSLVQAAWRTAGVALPRVSHEQFHGGTHLPLDQAQPGDLVFWADGRDPATIHHVGLILDGHRVLHAPEPGDRVKISPLWDSGELVSTVTRPRSE